MPEGITYVGIIYIACYGLGWVGTGHTHALLASIAHVCIVTCGIAVYTVKSKTVITKPPILTMFVLSAFSTLRSHAGSFRKKNIECFDFRHIYVHVHVGDTTVSILNL